MANHTVFLLNVANESDGGMGWGVMLFSNWTVNKSHESHVCFHLSKRTKEEFLSSSPASKGKLQCKLPHVVLPVASVPL